jgi:hypothetical protein
LADRRPSFADLRLSGARVREASIRFRIEGARHISNFWKRRFKSSAKVFSALLASLELFQSDGNPEMKNISIFMSRPQPSPKLRRKTVVAFGKWTCLN